MKSVVSVSKKEVKKQSLGNLRGWEQLLPILHKINNHCHKQDRAHKLLTGESQRHDLIVPYELHEKAEEGIARDAELQQAINEIINQLDSEGFIDGLADKDFVE